MKSRRYPAQLEFVSEQSTTFFNMGEKKNLTFRYEKKNFFFTDPFRVTNGDSLLCPARVFHFDVQNGEAVGSILTPQNIFLLPSHSCEISFEVKKPEFQPIHFQNYFYK
jgi:hypothetical protein